MNWTVSILIGEGKLLYWICGLKCEFHLKTSSQTLSEIMFCQISGHPTALSGWHLRLSSSVSLTLLKFCIQLHHGTDSVPRGRWRHWWWFWEGLPFGLAPSTGKKPRLYWSQSCIQQSLIDPSSKFKPQNKHAFQFLYIKAPLYEVLYLHICLCKTVQNGSCGPLMLKSNKHMTKLLISSYISWKYLITLKENH